jgi:ribosomal protein S14
MEARSAALMQQSTSESQGRFEIVCRVCDGLGIVFECAEDAPSSTVIKCRHCGGPRGTLGDLRGLAASGKQDLFEI